jgi:hypothetical protein
MRVAPTLVLLAIGLANPGRALAERVRLDVKVVEASMQGNAVDPHLVHMQQDFKRKGFAYSSYKMLSEPNVALDYKASTQVPLPNGKVAKITPIGKKDGKINVHLEIPGHLDLDYSVANGGTNFVGGGPVREGQNTESQVFLVIKHSLE